MVRAEIRLSGEILSRQKVISIQPWISMKEFLQKMWNEEYTIPDEWNRCTLYVHRTNHPVTAITLYDHSLDYNCNFSTSDLVVLASVLQGADIARRYYLQKRRYGQKRIEFYQGWFVSTEVVEELREYGLPIYTQQLYAV